MRGEGVVNKTNKRILIKSDATTVVLLKRLINCGPRLKCGTFARIVSEGPRRAQQCLKLDTCDMAIAS